MPKQNGAVPRLIPVSPPPGWAFFSPFDGYPYLLYVRNRGYALIFLDVRTEHPYHRQELDADIPDSCVYHLERDVGVQLITRFGPGWIICTLPFAGVRWHQRGSSGYGVSVDRVERFQVWLEQEIKRAARTPKNRAALN